MYMACKNEYIFQGNLGCCSDYQPKYKKTVAVWSGAIQICIGLICIGLHIGTFFYYFTWMDILFQGIWCGLFVSIEKGSDQIDK